MPLAADIRMLSLIDFLGDVIYGGVKRSSHEMMDRSMSSSYMASIHLFFRMEKSISLTGYLHAPSSPYEQSGKEIGCSRI